MRVCANCGQKLLKCRTPKGWEDFPSLRDLKKFSLPGKTRQDQKRYDVADFWIKKVGLKPTDVVCPDCFWK